jgi:hypothetical protein
MKKLMVFVFAGLMTLFVSASLFAGAMFQRQGTSTLGGGVASAAEIDEVPDQKFYPRPNPAVTQAGGSVSALPAIPLKPEAERLPPPFYAIAGVKGIAIRENGLDPSSRNANSRDENLDYMEVVDIIVILPERETFSRGILEGEDVSHWVGNLPAGLEARAHGLKKGANSIRIYISGTPTVTGRETVTVTIPGTYLTGGNERRFVSPTQEESQKAWEDSQTNQTN